MADSLFVAKNGVNSIGPILSAGVDLYDFFVTAVASNTGNYATRPYVDSTFVHLSGDTIFGGLSVIIGTPGTALVVSQTQPAGDIASFYDIFGEVLHVNNRQDLNEGSVGINTNYAHTALTVVGDISATAIVYASAFQGGLFDLPQLPNVIAQFVVDSDTYNQINNQNYNTGQFASSDYIATADNGDNETNFIDLGINNSNYADPLYNAIVANDGYLIMDGGALGIGTAQSKPIRFFTNGTQMTAVRMVILSSGEVGIGTLTPTALLTVNGQISGVSLSLTDGSTDKWNSAYTFNNATSALILGDLTTIAANSATWLYVLPTDVTTNSANWNSAFSYSNTTSASVVEGLSVVAANSATWGIGLSPIIPLTANWQSAFTEVNANSANWATTVLPTDVTTASANWNASYSALTATSASWNASFGLLTANSAKWNASYSALTAASGSWNNAYSILTTTSANWNASYSALTASSGSWDNIITVLNANSANYGTAFTYSNETSATILGDLTVVAVNSAHWSAAFTSYNANSATYATYPYVNTTFLALSGGTLSGDLVLRGDFTVYGALCALSGINLLGTTVFTTTSALSIINTGPGPAILIRQTGAVGDIATFEDIYGEVLHVGNRTSSVLGGTVGINTPVPNAALTVIGDISATAVVYSSAINIGLKVPTLLPNVIAQFTSDVDSYAQINFQNLNVGAIASSDFVVTSDNGNDTINYADFGVNNSAFSSPTFTIAGPNDAYLYANGGHLTVGTGNSKHLKFFTNGTLSSDVRMVVLSSGQVGIGEILPKDALSVIGNISASGNLSGANMLNNNWNSVYSTVYTNSASWLYNLPTAVTGSSANWNNAYSALTATSGSWNNSYALLATTSANWNNAYSALTATSASWNSNYALLVATSANWNNAYSALTATSASWNSGYSLLVTKSANWDNSYSALTATSANWNNSYSLLVTSSANWNNAYSALTATSGNWNSSYNLLVTTSANWNASYSALTATSASWDSTFTTVYTNSATWGGSSVALPTTLTTNSAQWNASYSALTATSGSWDSTFTTVYTNSASWGVGGAALPTTLTTNSANWNASYSALTATSGLWNNAYSALTAASGNWNSAYTWVNAASTNLTVTNNISAGSTVFAASALYVGVDRGIVVPNMVGEFVTNTNGYGQIIMQNLNGGANASSDFVVTTNNGTDVAGYANFGINNTTFADPAFAVVGAGDSYLYSASGNLVLGTSGVNDNLEFFTGGVKSFNTRMIIMSSGQVAIGGLSAVQPNMMLTVGAAISALYAGNSNDWGAAFSYNYATSALIQGDLTDIATTSANWDAGYSALTASSGSWNSVFTTVFTNSGSWGGGGGGALPTTITTNSAHWDSAFSYTNTNSAIITHFGEVIAMSYGARGFMF